MIAMYITLFKRTFLLPRSLDRNKRTYSLKKLVLVKTPRGMLSYSTGQRNVGTFRAQT